MENLMLKDNAITSASTKAETTTKLTRILLTGGMVVGPLYLIEGLVQAFTRPGFDITRHALSLLSNGDLGWIHITSLILSGLLVIGAAVGMRRVLQTGRGRTWGPLLLGLYGLGLIGAGIFRADPALDFPVGTPADAMTISWHGTLHLVCGGLGFLGLIAACFVMARRFAALGQRGWQTFSIATGLIFLGGFIGISMVWNNGWSMLGFWVGVIVAWAWLSALSTRLKGELANL